MRKYQNIFLIVVPPFRRTPAFESARALALSAGARLHLCMAVYSPAIAAIGVLSRLGAAAARAALVGAQSHLLEEEADTLRRQGLSVSTQVLWSAHPGGDLLRQIEVQRPDLVVKDAEPQRSPAGGLAPDDRMLRRCVVPLLLVHPGSAAMPKRIAAAIDTDRRESRDTAFNNLIVNTAAYIAQQSGAELHLLHAEPHMAQHHVPLRHGHPVRGYTPPALSRSPFEDFADVHAVPAERCHRLRGAAVDAVCEFATGHHVDLLVLGTQPRSLLQRLRHGNKIERIRRYAACDVLALKPARIRAQQATQETGNRLVNADATGAR